MLQTRVQLVSESRYLLSVIHRSASVKVAHQFIQTSGGQSVATALFFKVMPSLIKKSFPALTLISFNIVHSNSMTRYALSRILNDSI